jgi:negative regulator of sigma E activity
MVFTPVALLSGSGIVAVVLLAASWFVRALASGRLATKREVDAKDRQIESLMGTVATKDQTIADFAKAIGESNALTRAFLDVARDVQGRRDRSP